ncbi:acyl carrier protein [Nocardia sp. NPDC049149]|uniref:acyl carrier protein n=1 Tax=Nocardia sp. NPDC049149 TaxID=3364315 RepID=UPI00371E3E0A
MGSTGNRRECQEFAANLREIMTTEQFLQDLIVDSWLDGNGDGLRADTPILELNIISSVEIFELVHAIQKEFAIAIPLPDIRPENFRSIEAIAGLIERFRTKGKDSR